MSGTKRASADPAAERTSGKATEAPAVEFQPPLKPRPALFMILGVLLALWLIALGVMRLRTVRPPAAPASPVPQRVQQ